jgi:hypothetical protein
MSIQSILNKHFIWIDVIDHSIGISLMTSGIDYNNIILADFAKALCDIRSNI